MKLELPELPYAANALEPHMSAETFSFHHGKHHNTYVVKGNELLADAGIDADNLEDLVKEAAKVGGPLFNNVAQVYNHNLFWVSMKPNGGGAPTGAIADKINDDFGSYDKFRDEFVNNGIGQFGSGWVWLVLDGGTLKVVKTANAETPLTAGATPLLVCDVWEHAYYLDYQNRRPDFLASFLDNLVNWDQANDALASA
ncbi:superoxide dismutase [Pseudohongiella nitratireducens]|uniref:Superoxide dismutase n=1 Tax=Pseudohongiella nitratireducens TaxID=1768907 RepID=A0A916QKZ0_9GAMM|nr:superoxide dismutase [Pseudohongiella nitratireducens]MDF1623017.1 superoxide dismutase [Pseudohongiella nitratireducens]GFZ79049.1 superoxide dismutase [Pseudohongiella nitratireducens]|tara:strand:- start:2434 stop:3027 length:594 start_codon:yes stop_codon:yes gene_type:complete